MGKHGEKVTSSHKQNIIKEDSKKKAEKAEKIESKELKQNKKRKKRKILSYENVPIEEYSEETVKFNKRILKKTIIVFVIIIVLFAGVFLIANRSKFTWDNFSTWVSVNVLGSNKGEDFPVDTLGTTVSKGNFTMIGGHVSYASDTSYVELSDSAGRIINSQLSYSDPILRGTRNYSIVYGAGGNGFMVSDAKETKHKGTTKEGIFTADVNDNGYYCVVTQGSGYLSQLTAYNNENQKLYEYYFSDYYITCVSINPSGDGAVCTGITSKDGGEETKIYQLNFTEKKPVREYTLSDSMVYDTRYISSNKVCAVANNAVYTLDLTSDKPKVTEYNSRTLTTYDFNADTNVLSVVLSKSGDGRNCDILIFSSTGEIEKTLKWTDRVDSISTYKGNVGILSSGTAYILDDQSKVISKADAGNDAKALLLYSSNDAYVLGISEIRDISIDK